MVEKALFAYLHYLSFIALLSTLVLELVLFKQKLSASAAKRLQKIDSVYGLAAMATLITGGLRLFIYEKGYDYYISNHIFVTKLFLFLLVGLLSIYPTIVFLRWRSTLKTGSTIAMETSQFRKVRFIVRLETGLALLIPFLAALAARGVGFIA